MEDVDLDSARSEASAGLGAGATERPKCERRKRSQFAAVAKKNLVLIRRHWLGSTASQLLAPIVVMLILRMMQGIGDSSLSRPDPNPAEREVSDVEPCGREGCAAILYAPRGVAWVDDLMDLVREQSGLEPGEVAPVPTLQPLGPDEQAGAMWCLNNPGTPLPCPVQTLESSSLGLPVSAPDPFCSTPLFLQGNRISPCARMRDNRTISDYMVANPGRAANVVVFPAAYSGLSATSAREYPFGYDLYYNQTTARFPFRGNDHVLEVKRAIDQAILRFSGADAANLTVSWSTFPKPEPRLKGFSAVAVGGGYWFYLPAMIVFFTTLVDVVREKENGSRLMMSVMGLPSSVNLLVWLLQGFVFSNASALVLILAGLACRFDLFWNSSFLALFLLFSLFGTAMVAVSQVLATIMPSVKGAQTAGYAIILVGFVFQAILGSGYGSLIFLLQSTTLPGWAAPVKYVLQLYPPYLMSMVYYTISKKSASVVNLQEATVETGEGFSLADLFEKPSVGDTRLFGPMEVDVPRPATCLAILVLDTLLFALLALYLDHVVPTKNGILHHPLYFLRRSYWRAGGGWSKRDRAKLREGAGFTEVVDSMADFGSKDVIDEAVRVAESVPKSAEDESAILVSALTKIYGTKCCGRTKKAVDRLSVRLEKDSIFCLLGHNGAGKSTTMNILTGIVSPSEGFVSICGRDLCEDLGEIQSLIGVSPQFDCLWGELTALQHLEVYAAVKGVRPDRVREEAEYCLGYVDLLRVKDDQAHTYSGGMRRRLSLAIAMLGDPKAIFLDEPTTGMDPVHKQEAWAMIQRMKKDRIVVLTTHSMEEADCLGDRIGIMGSGRLQCVGTSLALKNAYGTGYRLRIFAPEETESGQVASEILGRVEGSKLVRSDAGSLTFSVPFGGVDDLPEAMNLLETRHVSKILEWSISHTTLEEVFLQVTSGCGFGEDFRRSAEDEGALEAASRHADRGDPRLQRTDTEAELNPPEHAFEIEMPQKPGEARSRRCSPHAGPVYGLVAKQGILQRRQTFQLLCQVGTPIVIMLMLTFLQVLVRVQTESATQGEGKRFLVGSIPYSLSTGFGLPFDLPKNASFGNFSSSGLAENGQYCLQRFSYFDGTGGGAGSLGSHGQGVGLLGRVSQHSCRLDYGTGEEILAPFFEPKPSTQEMVRELYDDLNELRAYNMSEMSKEPMPSYLLPDGAVSFADVDYNVSSLAYSFSVNDNFLLAYHRPNGITRARVWEGASHSFQNTGFSVLGNQGRALVMELVDRAFMATALPSHARYLGVLSGLPSYAKPLLGVGSTLLNMPQYEEGTMENLVEIFGSFLYPIALILQLPLYMYVTVMEKEKGLRQAQLNSGMSLLAYHASTFLFNLLLYALIVSFMVVVGHAVGLSFFAETSHAVLGVFFFGWGLAMVAFAAFLASLINSSRTATVVGYSVVLFGTGLGIMLSQGVYGDNPTRPEMPKMPAALNLLPQFAMIRGVYLMNWGCAMKQECVSGFGDGQLDACIGFLYLDFVLYSLAGFYLDKVLPKPNEPSSHWLFFLPEGWRARRKRRRVAPIRSLAEILSNSDRSDGPSAAVSSLDEDVCEEERRADACAEDEHELVVRDLSKDFGGNVAVGGVGLVVDRGECFGLLGENGAGKTTLIKMLSCSLQPTTGTAHLCGHDVTEKPERVQKLVGICPQFDVLWDDLTVREHLLLFLRLKGASSARKDVGSILTEVGLLASKDKRVKELSGGMKRRLSVALALCGDSRVILLDEVTTGLDPYSRRQLWDVLRTCRGGRAMVLTTHSMDEAELLCTRLAVMVKGRLRCMGTSDHLKEKFGRGYMVLLNFPDETKACVTEFLAEKFALGAEGGAEIVKDFPGQLVARVPVSGKPGEGATAGYRMSSIFRVMVREAEGRGITDWAVSQVGLNEVFRAVLDRANAAPTREFPLSP